jgi:tRNA (mo5U34)-methyltransferase
MYAPLFQLLIENGFEDWTPILKTHIAERLSTKAHGNFAHWQSVLAHLPVIPPEHIDLNSAAITVSTAYCSTEIQAQIKTQLKEFMPWRKGPFLIHGIYIDTEWRSDWKWDRIVPHISDLKGRTVLDVGCGSGYHCWRMAGAGARMVWGIDPSLIAVMQYKILHHFLGPQPVCVTPQRLEDLPNRLEFFDTVFSMGVLYHRRSPIDHLLSLKSCLRPGGELVLETLIIEGDGNTTLLPAERYAQMSNVWFIPSCIALEGWLLRCGFVNVRCVNINQTSTDEQRSTEWMPFSSLPQFLDTKDKNLTTEGLPAPRRAVFIAKNPD